MPVLLLADHGLHVRGAGWQCVKHCRCFVKERQDETDERTEHAWQEDGQDDDHRGKSESLSHSNGVQVSLVKQHRPVPPPLCGLFLLRKDSQGWGEGNTRV